MTTNKPASNDELFGPDHKMSQWIPLCEIAKGDLSVVFKVTDSEGKVKAAMKVEELKKPNKKYIEKDILKALCDSPHSLHLIDYSSNDFYRITVMSLAGPTLGTIKEMMQNKFSDSTILRLAIRTLMGLKDLHEHGFVHRDLEPGNIALSLCKMSRHVYLLDFGEARQYARKDENGKWILKAPRSKVPFRGSNQYCSPTMHDYKEQGRVDDIWMWMFLFCELRVALPWTDLTAVFRYGPLKRTLTDEMLQEWDPLLTVFIPIVQIMRATSYADRPDYFKIYEILAAKMASIDAKWTDPMDYDLITDRTTLFSKNPEKDERMTEEQISAVFQEVVVPGGQQYVLPSHIPFAPPTEKEIRKKKEVEKEKEKEEKKEKETLKEKEKKEKEIEKEKETLKEKKKVKEEKKEKEKEKANKKSKEVVVKEKEKRNGSAEKTTEKTADTPSKNVDAKSKQKTVKNAIPLKTKKGKTSTTSSASRQTSPTLEKQAPLRPVRVVSKKKAAVAPTKLKVK